jgi:hypothetical protein
MDSFISCIGIAYISTCSSLYLYHPAYYTSL